MMDDFIYGEPQPRGRVMDVSSDEPASSEPQRRKPPPPQRTKAQPPPRPKPMALTVNNGSASGTAPGTVVTVTANPAPAGQRFAGWTGDITILASPSEETTTATVPPTTPVTITATYEPSSTEP